MFSVLCGFYASCDTLRTGAPSATVYQKQLQSCKIIQIYRKSRDTAQIDKIHNNIRHEGKIDYKYRLYWLDGYIRQIRYKNKQIGKYFRKIAEIDISDSNIRQIEEINQKD